jgi:peptide/nickel transport system permease protein
MKLHPVRHIGFTCAAVLLLLVMAAAIFAPWLPIASPYQQDLTYRLVPPIWDSTGTWIHPLGTDNLGRDMLSRIVYGARVSLAIGLVSVSLAAFIGTALGLAAGYYRGATDSAIMFVVNARLAIPIMLIALAIVALKGGTFGTLVLVLGLLLWDRFAVVVRGAVMQEKARDYVQAAKTFGCSDLYIMLREILPNISGPLIVVATFEVAHAILLEASLSFLGLGVEPPTPTWGTMMADGKDLIYFDAWAIGVPGVALFALLLLVNVIGDGFRRMLAREVQP